MAPKFPDEVNVFIVPHSRMKDLVGSYMDHLSNVDFRSHAALETLLPILEKTFTEFKTHEHIENQYIMERLKQRLKLVNVTSHQSVCNCHGDNRLVEILNLLRDGYTCTSKPIAERINFGFQLQKAITEFTEKFIPHMLEEEEVFQPLLMKYFAYEELCSLKEQVIQQHEIWKEKLLAQKETAENMLLLLDTVATEQYQDTLQSLVEFNLAQRDVGFNDLPEEMMTHIFSYLNNPRDRIRCAQVCKRWNMVVYSPQLWKTVYPTNWAKGIYDFQYHDPYPMVEIEWTRSNLGDNESALMSYDEDPSPQVERERRFYEQFTLNALVRIGEGVQRLVVAGGLQLSSEMLHSMLILCPNIEYLDASYTNITDLSFKGLAAREACIRLEHLDLTGCRFITDVGLERLGACFRLGPNSGCNSCCNSCKKCPKMEKFDSNNSLDQQLSPGLLHLSLSGCTSVTDYGLRSLLEVSLETDSLSFMDLSGCPLISGPFLNEIIQQSSRLLPQDLYYCNRIEEGPYPDEANGCQNLECPLRACCCFDNLCS